MPSPRIVNALLAHSPDSVHELFDAFGEHIFQYCWLMLRSRDAAQAALRDTMLAAHEHVGRLADTGKFAPWLYALARAACKRYGPLPPDMADEPPARDGDPDANNKLIAWRSVMRLAPADREVLDLTARHGLPADDIGLVTGLDDVAAAILIVQAQSRLRDTLAAELGFDTPPGVVSIPKVYGCLPAPEPPSGMREAVLAAFGDPGQFAHAVAFVPPLDGAGFPSPGQATTPARQATTPVRQAPRRRLAAGVLAAALAGAAVYLLWATVLSLPAGNQSAYHSAPGSSPASGAALGDEPVTVANPKLPARAPGKGGSSGPAGPVLGPLPGDVSGKSVYVTATSPVTPQSAAHPGGPSSGWQPDTGSGGAPSSSTLPVSPTSGPSSSQPSQSASPSSSPSGSASPTSGPTGSASSTPTASESASPTTSGSPSSTAPSSSAPSSSASASSTAPASPSVSPSTDTATATPTAGSGSGKPSASS
ncbi:MAG: RNA polymerase sigma factor [Trebonia sp.]